MNEKIILGIIDLFRGVIPILQIIAGLLGLFWGLQNNWIVGLATLAGCLISAAAAYGFSVILSAAYVYLWKEKQQQQTSE